MNRQIAAFALLVIPAAALDEAFAGQADVHVYQRHDVVQVEWARDPDGKILPALSLTGRDSEPIDVMLTLRTAFAGRVSAWSVGPFRVDAETSQEIDVGVPAEAHWNSQQRFYFTDLEMTVETYTAAGQLVGTTSGPRLKILWVDDRFAFYSPAEAARLAPHGFVGAPSPDAARILKSAQNDNIEIGPAQ